ncbi:MAG: type I 3-dehydroquinate dehydratase [Candidatus Altiarchaeales archaeon]|nr:type I 3-dehydroquinate dehydratase [Candidatus Altiarchaeales archaeon]
MICAPIIEKELNSMIETANSTKADSVELRLDYLTEFSGIDELTKIQKPAIATCMPKFEGGNFAGPEEERIDILRKALEFSSHVTIELKTETNLRDPLIREARGKGVKVIISHHDFNSTPGKEEILSVLKQEEEAGADIAKVAFMPKNHADVLNILAAVTENPTKIPVIAIAMGELGKASRILGPALGSYLTYASTGKGRESAPGQLTVEELKRVLNIIG